MKRWGLATRDLATVDRAKPRGGVLLRSPKHSVIGRPGLTLGQSAPVAPMRPPLNPGLYAERRKVQHFVQRIERFRRTALRWEKTLTSFMGFVVRVSALDWPR